MLPDSVERGVNAGPNAAPNVARAAQSHLECSVPVCQKLDGSKGALEGGDLEEDES